MNEQMEFTCDRNDERVLSSVGDNNSCFRSTNQKTPKGMDRWDDFFVDQSVGSLQDVAVADLT